MIFQVTPRSSVFPCEKSRLGRTARAWAGAETPPQPAWHTVGTGWLQELLWGVTFCASRTQHSEDAFGHQDASVEPPKISHSPEMGQHEGPATAVSNNVSISSSCSRSSQQRLERLRRRFYCHSWKNRTERPNSLLEVTKWWFPCHLSASTVARRQQSSATSLLLLSAARTCPEP